MQQVKSSTASLGDSWRFKVGTHQPNSFPLHRDPTCLANLFDLEPCGNVKDHCHPFQGSTICFPLSKWKHDSIPGRDKLTKRQRDTALLTLEFAITFHGYFWHGAIQRLASSTPSKQPLWTAQAQQAGSGIIPLGLREGGKMSPSVLFFRIFHFKKKCCRLKEGIEGNSILLSGYDINRPQLSTV